jgi:ArsR family transcriptional regulator
MIDTPTATKIATLLYALGEGTRLLLLHELISGERSVKDLARVVGKHPMNASHHLRVLLDAGVVTVRQEGRKRYYAIAPGKFHNSVPGALGVFTEAGCQVTLTAPRSKKK